MRCNINDTITVFTSDCCCGSYCYYTILQERQAALAAVTSQLWEGRNGAAANRPQPSASYRATVNSPMLQGPALPSIPGPSADTLTAAAKHATPTACDTVTRDMSSGTVSAQQGRDKADAQKSSQPQAPVLQQKPTSAGTISQEGISGGQPGHSERQESHSEGQQGQSEGRKGPSETQLSERESRAAARLSRLAQSATNTGSKKSQESKADHAFYSKGNTGRFWASFSFCSLVSAYVSQEMVRYTIMV